MLNKWIYVECLLCGPKEWFPQVTRDRKSRVSPVQVECGYLLDVPVLLWVCCWVWLAPSAAECEPDLNSCRCTSGWRWPAVGITLRGCKSQLSPPPVSGRKGGYCRGIQALGGKAILEECCGHGWIGYVCSPGNTETSRASSASKVSGECQQCLLLALGQLGTGRVLLIVINQQFHPWRKFQEILAPLARVLKSVRNSPSHVTCANIPHHCWQHSASVSLALTS